MVLFLLHVRASLIIAVTLPTAVLMSFIAMKLFNVDANIMSLAGIAIAIGTMVDMGVDIEHTLPLCSGREQCLSCGAALNRDCLPSQSSTCGT